MSPSPAATPETQPSQTIAQKPNQQAWYRPIASPEHGVYVMLLVAVLTGAAAAQQWTWHTTLAAISAFCGFQAEHPWILQIKQRRSFKPRFWVWGSLYSSIAGAIALYLYWIQPESRSLLLAIYAGAIVAFTIDAISVLYREQKSIPNELITFAAVCLTIPFVYISTTGTISTFIIGLWLLNSLFFCSTIFTVKFRKDKTHSPIPAIIYHSIAPIIISAFWFLAGLPWLTAIAFGVALFKFGFILWQRDWYCTTPIKSVALLETSAAFLFGAIVIVSIYL